jgi:adenosylmethionine-8-amino-7-oxononanoate aminotransferase
MWPAFIFEPLVQGAAAMRMYDASFLDELIVMAQGYGVLCIADEVMTGFGKNRQEFCIRIPAKQPRIFFVCPSH